MSYSEDLTAFCDFLYHSDFRVHTDFKDNNLDYETKLRFISVLRVLYQEQLEFRIGKQASMVVNPDSVYAQIIGKVDNLEQLLEFNKLFPVPSASELILIHNQHLPEDAKLFIKMGGLS